MDYSKTRCPICLNRFCCLQHKNAHLKKQHPEHLKRLSQGHLLKLFQKKAERIILNAQKYRAHNMKVDSQPVKNPENSNTANTNINTNTNKSRPAIKRLHQEINQQIISTSVIITSEIRKILIPAHRSKRKALLNSEIKPKLKAFVETRKSSPCDTGIPFVETSTPIIKNQLIQSTPQDSWNISQTSSISSYHTPSSLGDQKSTVYETPIISENDYKSGVTMSSKTQVYQTKRSVTSPRSIMSKTSKYNYELGPNINPNISKCRRVTFSFASSNSSPLESLQEVEIDKEVEDEHVFSYDGQLENYVETKNLSEGRNQETDKLKEELNPEKIENSITNTSSDIMNKMSRDQNDSSPSEKTKTGFFNCVTNMICSAVPLFASWRGVDSNNGTRSKRSRSPDRKFVGVEVIQSPKYKRLCYPYDLRLNPIKARKSISQQ